MFKIEELLKNNKIKKDFINKLKNAKNIDEIHSIFTSFDTSITLSEVKDWLDKHQNSDISKISDNELENIAGGIKNFDRLKAAALSSLIFAGGFSAQIGSNVAFAATPQSSSSINNKDTQKIANKLCLYALEGNKKAIEKMLTEKIDINTKDAYGKTALFSAVVNNNPEMVNFLIDKGIDVNIKDKTEKSAIDYASDPEIIEAILKKSDKNYDKKPITFITLERYELTIRLLAAASRGDVKKVEEVFESGAFISAKNKATGMNALMYACKNGHIEVARFLIEKGAKLDATDKNGRTALMYAASSGKVNITKLLIETKSDIVSAEDSEKNSTLMYAVDSKNIEMVRFIISKGANINRGNNYDNTPLNKSIYLKKPDIAKLLIENGADVNGLKNENPKCLPLITAASLNDIEMVKLLVNNGADINKKNSEGDTPLHYAASRNHSKIIEFFISKNVDVNVFNNLGVSPTMRAAVNGNKKILKLLIKGGANPNLKNKSGQTAIDYAIKPEIKKFLKANN